MSCASYLPWCRKKKPETSWAGRGAEGSRWCLIRSRAKSNCLIIISQSIFHFTNIFSIFAPATEENCLVIRPSIIARRTARLMARDNVLGVCVYPLAEAFACDKCMINYFIICKLVFRLIQIRFSSSTDLHCILWGAATTRTSLRWMSVISYRYYIYLYCIVCIVKCIKSPAKNVPRMAELFSICRAFCPSECGLHVVPLQLRVFDILHKLATCSTSKLVKSPKLERPLKCFCSF